MVYINGLYEQSEYDNLLMVQEVLDEVDKEAA